MKTRLFISGLLLILLNFSININAQTVNNDSIAPKTSLSVTKHSIVINGKQINYTATTGTLLLRTDKDESSALIGFTAYTKDGENPVKRPITFTYNGGPGSASVWLHVGVIGPRRVVVNDPGTNGPAPYTMEDNQYSILDVSDIVLIDPVGTGFSHAVGKSKNTDFWNVDADIKSVSQFIRQYITGNERWNSPKFLLGESYGTFRSAGVANYLQENYGISANGVMLLSSVLDIRTIAFQPGDDLSYVLNLPTYSATAWYHNKLPNKPANLTGFLQEVRDFSSGAYATALLKGDQLPAAERESILTRLVAYTGLSRDFLDKANLRVTEPQFAAELLRDSSEIIGRLDSRYTEINAHLLSETTGNDPLSTGIMPAYISAFMNYYTTELKGDKDKTYNIFATDPDFKWDWKHPRSYGLFGTGSTASTSPDLLNAMTSNPKLKVLVMNGLFDLATPFYGTEYTFSHLGLSPKLRKNVIFKYYEAWHMVYIHEPSAAIFKKDVADFISNN